jgi:hypothetical protein
VKNSGSIVDFGFPGGSKIEEKMKQQTDILKFESLQN